MFKKITYVIAVFLFFVGLLSATEVSFERIPSEEIPEVENQILLFYAESLLKAGLFDDIEIALEGAKEEVAYQKEQHHYFYIHSNINEDVCGYLVYSLGGEIAYLEAIKINQTCQNQGIGKNTLKHLESELKNIGIRTIRLYVFAHNEIAFNLYNNLGYNIEHKYEIDGKLIGFHMKKNII